MRNLARFIFGLAVVCGIVGLIMVVGDLHNITQNKYSISSGATSLLVFAAAIGLMVIVYKIPIKDNQSTGR